MNDFAFESDLVVLTADKNMQFTVKGLLDRPRDIGIRPIRAAFYIHPERDPGCRLRADNFLRPFIKHAAFAIVLFDREGCGKHNKSRIELEIEVSSRLAISGWKDRSSCITIDPELENWIFSDSPELDYSKNPGWLTYPLPRTEEANAHYKNPDNDPNGHWFMGNLSSPNQDQIFATPLNLR